MSSGPLTAALEATSIVAQSTASLSDVSGQEFDYVIIGGGTSGLALAARLAEDPNVTVAVLETGGELHTYDTIRVPAHYAREHGNPELVYNYKSVPQAKLKRPIVNDRGRGIGGTSAINFFVFQKPPAGDVDMWERLGSPGWNWDRFHAALKKAETFHPPSAEDAAKFGYEFDPNSHGTDGPIQTSFAKIQTAGENKVKETYINLGHKAVADPAGGNILGIGSYPNNADPRTNTRSFAATGYFLNKAGNANLKVLPFATARRVLFRNATVEGSEDLVAEGVEFDSEGLVHVVRAKREVIIAAGAFRSPAILELSGIGNRKVLEAVEIPTRIHNPAVGENLQEHLISSVTWELDTQKHDLKTIDSLADPEYAAEQFKLYTQGKGMFLSQMTYIAWLSFEKICSSPARFAELVAAEEARIAEELKKPDLPAGLAEQWALQLERLKQADQPDTEFITVPFHFPALTASPQPGKSYISLVCGLNHPFSRGSIHIRSSDPHEHAEMDPNVFDHPFDLELLVEMFKYCRKFAQTEPFKDIIVAEAAPGPNVVTDEGIREYILNNVGSTWHTAGPCAMRPHDKGGVVDSSLKVYGTRNLRVGDISIMPLHVGAHTQTSAYAIAEQLADILKAEARAN